ncbi:MAG: IS1634 family transposase [Rubrobacter sp.]
MDESEAPQIEVQNIDHLGIVAGIIDEIGLVEEIDHLLGTHSQEHVSSGQALKAMILNGSGFVSAPLYLFEEFFLGKATEHLIDPGVRPEHLNDDRLGRVLDKLFDADPSKIFVDVALRAARHFGVRTESVHLDATSLHLHGHYAHDNQEVEPEAIRITHGYSRDHRPELKQFVVDLMCTGDGGIPLFLRVADGNEADQATFAKLLAEFKMRLDFDALFVADSALYSAEKLPALNHLRWLCRVPQTIKEAKTLLEEIPQESFITESAPESYRLAETESEYGGVKQRWVVVESPERQKAQNERLEKKLEELDERLERRLRRLRRERFNCEADARKALQSFAKDLGEHHLLTEGELIPVRSYQKPGRPSKGEQPEVVGYRLETNLARDEQAIAVARRRSGRFILATNVLDGEQFGKEALLHEYKAQHVVERGFRFLKDPMFFTSSVFVKSPKRVAAIALVMGLSLLVYALGERALRRALKEAEAKVRHQTGKLTDRPTLRWIFQLFQAVHLLSDALIVKS